MRTVRTSYLPVLLCLLLASASALAGKKEPLQNKHLQSGSFAKLMRETGAGPLQLRFLYEMSGAENYKEFSRALMAAHNLRVNRQLVLYSLHEKKLEEALQDAGITEDRAKAAIRTAKRMLEDADKKADRDRRARRQ